jgi:hypothetical protein
LFEVAHLSLKSFRGGKQLVGVVRATTDSVVYKYSGPTRPHERLALFARRVLTPD